MSMIASSGWAPHSRISSSDLSAWGWYQLTLDGALVWYTRSQCSFLSIYFGADRGAQASRTAFASWTASPSAAKWQKMSSGVEPNR